VSSSSRLRIPLFLACGGSFLAFLDATVTNLAVPALTHDFGGVSITSLSWVVTLYTTVFAALLAPAGRMADVLGRRQLYVLGVITFTAASLAAALAPAFWVVLLARAAQGAGAAAMMPASLAFVLAEAPPEMRTKAIGLWSAAASAAAAIGPALGGVIVDALGWRALFVINLPLGAVLARVALRRPPTPAQHERVPDLTGTALLTVGVGMLVLAITEGQHWGWVRPPTLACLLAAIAGLGVGLMRASRHPAPAVEVRLWRSRTYATANVVSALFGAALYSALLLGVLVLVEVWHYSELQAGLAVTPGAVASAAVGICIGRLDRRPSPRALAAGGAAAIGLVSAGLGLWLPAQPHFISLWLPTICVSGAGMGAVSVGVSTAAALSVAPNRFAAATGLNVAARQIGGALGVAVLAVLLAGRSAGGGSAPFAHVYLFGAAASLAAAVLASRLRIPPSNAVADDAGNHATAKALAATAGAGGD
jgi:EmrB/QacA subfamily drug resistance transporter